MTPEEREQHDAQKKENEGVRDDIYYTYCDLGHWLDYACKNGVSLTDRLPFLQVYAAILQAHSLARIADVLEAKK